MVVNEPEAKALSERLDAHNERLYCATGAWEATVAIARIRKVSLEEASDVLLRLLADLTIRLVPIDEVESRMAIAAQGRYGKGSGHPARLNMGDCFAYACVKANGAALLYKGDDFARTDLG